MKILHLISLALLLCLLNSCTSKKTDDSAALQKRVQAYLDDYNSQFQKLLYADNLAQWELQTHIVEGDTTSKNQAAIADEALTTYTGSEANIDSSKKFLQEKKKLTDLQAR